MRPTPPVGRKHISGVTLDETSLFGTEQACHSCFQWGRGRDAAAAGVDNIVAPLLKANLVMAQWLHCVIVAVWVSGKAPLDWTLALKVPLFKGKGSARDTANHRPISLLSIPGKVYALILLHRVSDQVDSQLLESQCAFRTNRGLSDPPTHCGQSCTSSTGTSSRCTWPLLTCARLVTPSPEMHFGVYCPQMVWSLGSLSCCQTCTPAHRRQAGRRARACGRSSCT